MCPSIMSLKSLGVPGNGNTGHFLEYFVCISLEFLFNFILRVFRVVEIELNCTLELKLCLRCVLCALAQLQLGFDV